jgi:hypothetical protein
LPSTAPRPGGPEGLTRELLDPTTGRTVLLVAYLGSTGLKLGAAAAAVVGRRAFRGSLGVRDAGAELLVVGSEAAVGSAEWW